jgi:hypothetical protein
MYREGATILWMIGQDSSLPITTRCHAAFMSAIDGGPARSVCLPHRDDLALSRIAEVLAV